jgi:hypothetical protein
VGLGEPEGRSELDGFGEADLVGIVGALVVGARVGALVVGALVVGARVVGFKVVVALVVAILVVMSAKFATLPKKLGLPRGGWSAFWAKMVEPINRAVARVTVKSFLITSF